MVDWANGVVQTRNYGIRREPDSRSVREVTWILLSIVVLAGVLFFHSWVRSRIVDLGYLEQTLQVKETALERAEKALILEEQTLKNLERIDAIARLELNMVPVRPSQLVAPPYQELEPRSGTVLAMANAPQSSPESRKLSATN